MCGQLGRHSTQLVVMPGIQASRPAATQQHQRGHWRGQCWGKHRQTQLERLGVHARSNQAKGGRQGAGGCEGRGTSEPCAAPGPGSWCAGGLVPLLRGAEQKGGEAQQARLRQPREVDLSPTVTSAAWCRSLGALSEPSMRPSESTERVPCPRLMNLCIEHGSPSTPTRVLEG